MELVCVTTFIYTMGSDKVEFSLFSVYVDDLSDKLIKSKTGCHINNLCMNQVMYAVWFLSQNHISYHVLFYIWII